MKRMAFGLIVLIASLTQAQTAPVLTRANRQQVVDSLNAVMQKQTDNVAYAEITGDSITSPVSASVEGGATCQFSSKSTAGAAPGAATG